MSPGTTNLVSAWSMNETTGDRVDDFGSNDLTSMNSAGSAAGVNGNAVDLDRSSTHYLRIPDADQTGLDTGSSDFTLVLPVRLDAAITSGLVEYQLYNRYLSTGNNRSLALTYIYNGGTPALQVITSSNGSGINYGNRTQTLSAATWYHLMFLYDASAGSMEMFVDNSSIGSVTGLDTSLYGGTAPTEIGAQAGSWRIDGRVDDTFLFNALLTADERSWMYNSGSYRATSELTGGGGATVLPQFAGFAGL